MHVAHDRSIGINWLRCIQDVSTVRPQLSGGLRESPLYQSGKGRCPVIRRVQLRRQIAVNHLILDWSQAITAGPEACGGKGWNLARLQRYGFPVPCGGIITGALYRQTIGHPDIIPLIHQFQSMDNSQQIVESDEHLLWELRQAILTLGLPSGFDPSLHTFLQQQQLNEAALAIRSSATLEDGRATSFAGIHESYLNIRGIADIKRAILNCYASLWTPRALSYRRKMGLADRQLECAVVIMVLVDSHASGVAFSCDPTSGREDISIINANFGLGESVVGGEIEPDEYRLNSHHMTLQSCKIGSKQKQTLPSTSGGTCLTDAPKGAHEQVLPEELIRVLGRLVQRVFWALGQSQDQDQGGIGESQHQDVEWAFDGHDFFILQARPVTALPRLGFDALRNRPVIWSNGNFRDAAPMVLHTLGASLFAHHIRTVMSAPFRQIGYRLPEGLSFLKLFQGRAYLNVSLLQWIYFDSTGYPPAAFNRALGGHQPESNIDKIYHGGLSKRLLRRWRNFKMMRMLMRHKKVAEARNAKEAAFANRIMDTELSTLGDAALAKKIERCDLRLEGYALPFAMQSSMSGSVMELFKLLEKHLPGRGTATATALLAGAGDITSANLGYRLKEIAMLVPDDSAAQLFFEDHPFEPEAWQQLPNSSPFKQAFQSFIKEYGHRAIHETDLSTPRWREEPGYLLRAIKRNIGGPAPLLLKAQQKEKAEQAWLSVKKTLPLYLRPCVRMLVKQAAEGAAFREMGKSTVIRLVEPARLLYLEAGRRLQARRLLQNADDIFHCAYVEIISLLNGEWDGRGLMPLIERRRATKTAQEQLSPPDLILDDQPQFSKPATIGSGEALKGIGVAAGRAQGTARLVQTPEQGIALKPGEVLVAPSTDPAWTPLFLNAAAIVVETGGQLSHGAIVAREYGIPAVVNIPGLFRVIKDGEQIVVDGDRGTVERLPGKK